MIPLFFLSACAEKKEAPDPPLARSTALIELFDALGAGDHQAAINKISKLRQLDPQNVFLARIEKSEKSNLLIAEAQKYLDKSEPDRALAIIDSGISLNGRIESLQKARTDIINMKLASKYIFGLVRPAGSISVAKNLVGLKTLMGNYPDIIPCLNSFLDEKLYLAYKLEHNEKHLHLADMAAEVDKLLAASKPEAASLLAQLAVEAPNYPLVREYYTWLADPSVNTKFSYLKSSLKQR